MPITVIMNTTYTTPFVTDILIIGAGPVGLFTVFACGMLGLKAHVVDALPDIGGQCTALYPEKPIYDIPGFPRIEAGALIAALEAQAAPFAPVFHMGQQVTHVTRTDAGRFTVHTSAGAQFDTGAVIIAAGAGAFGPNRPPLPNLADYEGKSVFYMVRDKGQFAGKHVVIAGGGDSAVDWAIALAPIAARVQVVHRRGIFRAAPQSVATLEGLAQQGALDLITPAQLKALHGQCGQLEHVTVADLDGHTRTLKADALLAFYGLAATLGPIATWGLDLSGATIKTDMATGATTVPGIFAVGDIASYTHKLKLIVTGFAEASGAAHAAYRYLYPDRALHMEHSTDKGIPVMPQQAPHAAE